MHSIFALFHCLLVVCLLITYALSKKDVYFNIYHLNVLLAALGLF